MKIVGIDPGKTGGLCCMDENTIIEVCVMPTRTLKSGKDIIDFKLVAEFIKKHNPDKIYLEQVSVGLLGGRVSMFQFGGSYYGLMATCEVLKFLLVYKFELFLVLPQRWKKCVLGEDYDHEDKQGTMKFCKEKFPNTNFLATKRSRVFHDGICDATAIAYYGFLNEE